jgi:tRNA-dihydrouridine synthase B
MSVDLEPSAALCRPAPSRPIADIARSCTVDPRIRAIVPGFDAPFFQAGLAGYSDGAMRLIARRHGCPYCVTEALLDLTLINGGKGRTREDPDLLATECGMGDLKDNIAAGLDDHPIAGQIMGTHPDTMAKGAALLASMNHDTIDVNFACPVKKIKKSNRGGHFLTSPDAAIEVLSAVRDAVPKDVPTTVKLRRAWDDSPEMAANFEHIFNAAYELGYVWTTVHCRTVQQKYHGPGRWPFLTDLVKRHPDKLIFGSGDVWTVQDIFAMLDVTGVHAVAVARGCIGNPWIFRQARQYMAGEQPSPPTLAEQRDVLLEHFKLAAALHGERVASRTMRKFGIKFAAHHPNAQAVRTEFIRCSSTQHWQHVVETHYSG